MKRETRARAGVALAMGVCMLSGCGAKTELRVRPGDASVDALRKDLCAAGAIALPRADAEAMLLLDRSGSMQWDLAGNVRGGAPRWDVLRDALAASLPPYDDRIAFGLWLFPVFDQESCMIAPTPSLEPARGRAREVLGALAARAPGGGTPTHAAVRAAGDWLTGRAAPGRTQAIVLATDGAPNCNEELDPNACYCTGSSAGSCAGARDSTLCLDDRRAVAEVAAVAARAIPVYVIGIDGDREPLLVSVLDRLAVAGGRPRSAADGRRYYSVQRREDLDAAFRAIQPLISECARVAPQRPAAEQRMSVTSDGAPVARDTSRRDGWDWADATSRTMVFYGAACDRTARGTGAVTVRYDCQ